MRQNIPYRFGSNDVMIAYISKISDFVFYALLSY